MVKNEVRQNTFTLTTFIPTFFFQGRGTSSGGHITYSLIESRRTGSRVVAQQ